MKNALDERGKGHEIEDLVRSLETILVKLDNLSLHVAGAHVSLAIADLNGKPHR